MSAEHKIFSVVRNHKERMEREELNLSEDLAEVKVTVAMLQETINNLKEQHSELQSSSSQELMKMKKEVEDLKKLKPKVPDLERKEEAVEEKVEATEIQLDLDHQVDVSKELTSGSHRIEHDASGLHVQDKRQTCEGDTDHGHGDMGTDHGHTVETLIGQRSHISISRTSVTEEIGHKTSSTSRASSRARSIMNIVLGPPSVYLLEGSIWECVFFIGLENVLSMRDNLLLALCFVVNAAIQIFLCNILMQDAFQEHPFPDQFFNDVQAWRLTDAHSDTYGNPVRTASLASRVCNEDRALTMSTNQQTLYFTIGEYFSSKGELLAIVSIVVWTCCCAAEMRKCLSFFCALLNVPRSGATTIKFKGEQWRLDSISRSRVWFGLLVFCARVSITVTLLRSGGRWLAYTESIKDLLLNASALGFVMEIDELIHDAFVPLHMEEILRDFKPLDLSVNNIVAHLAPQALFIASVAMVFISEYMWLSPLSKDMKDLKFILCDGEQDFVYGVDSFQRVMWIRTAPYGEVSNSSETQRAIVHALIRSDIDYVEKVSIQKHAGHFFNLDLKLTQSELVNRLESCRNYAGENLGMMLWSVSGSKEFYNSSLANCEDLLQAFPLICEARGTGLLGAGAETVAGNYVRFQCPVSCGCNDVASGLFALGTQYYGCPLQVCRTEMQFLLANNSQHLKCKDRVPGQLQTNLHWQRFARILSNFIFSAYSGNFMRRNLPSDAGDVFQAAQTSSPGATNSTEVTEDQISMLFTSLGCGSITVVRSTLNEQEVESLCMDYHHGASFYCPESCGCKLADVGLVPARERCPASCFQGSGESQPSEGAVDSEPSGIFRGGLRDRLGQR